MDHEPVSRINEWTLIAENHRACYSLREGFLLACHRPRRWEYCVDTTEMHDNSTDERV